MSEKQAVKGVKYYLLCLHNEEKLHFPAEVFLMN